MGDHELPPSLQRTHELRERGGVSVLLRRDWTEALPVDEMLRGAPLEAWGRPVSHDLRGRGTLHVLATSRGDIVAKRLLRGGAAGALLRGWFADPRRPWCEAEAAEQLLARGCPTSPVVAARSMRGPPGLHRLEIATVRIDCRGNLLDVLRSTVSPRPLPSPSPPSSLLPSSLPLLRLAELAGRSVRRLHDAGLRHRDLNARNLLVTRAQADTPEAALVVIDLDRCRVGEPLATVERVASLARLARSLVKAGVLPRRRGERSAELRACRAFLAGYGAVADRRRARILAAVAAHLRAALRVHGLAWRQAAAGMRDAPGRTD